MKTLVLIFVLLASISVLAACGAGEQETGKQSEQHSYSQTASQKLEFTSNGDGTCYVSGIGSYEDVSIIVIPSVSPEGDSVTSIGKEAFNRCRRLTSVTIPNGVTSIGKEAFYLCTNLISVTIPDSVRLVGDGVFEGCINLAGLTTSAGESIPNTSTPLDGVEPITD